jgi:predicted MFS family arabinose efflux permease
VSSQTVNRTSAVIAAVCITFISVGSFLILPVLVGAAADDMGLTERQVGFLASAGMAGAALSSALAVFWIRRVDWRRAGYLSVGVLLAAHASALFVDDFSLFMLCQLLAGVGGGAAYSLALTSLSDNRHPDRCFGFSVAAQVSFQVVGLLALPLVIERFGLNGVLGVLVSLECIALVVLRWLPRAGTETSHVPIGRALFKPRVLAALAGCFFFFFNVGAVWTYVERMGVAAAFDPGFIGIALAAGVAFGIPGALLASWCSDRFGRVTPLALGAVGTVVAVALLADGMSKGNYVLALALYNFVWNFSLAFQYAAVNAADASGRSVAAAPAFHAAGGAVGPGVAALFMTSGSFSAVLVLAAGAVILSFLMFVFAVESRSKAATVCGDDPI